MMPHVVVGYDFSSISHDEVDRSIDDGDRTNDDAMNVTFVENIITNKKSKKMKSHTVSSLSSSLSSQQQSLLNPFEFSPEEARRIRRLYHAVSNKVHSALLFLKQKTRAISKSKQGSVLYQHRSIGAANRMLRAKSHKNAKRSHPLNCASPSTSCSVDSSSSSSVWHEDQDTHFGQADNDNDLIEPTVLANAEWFEDNNDDDHVELLPPKNTDVPKFFSEEEDGYRLLEKELEVVVSLCPSLINDDCGAGEQLALTLETFQEDLSFWFRVRGRFLPWFRSPAAALPLTNVEEITTTENQTTQDILSSKISKKELRDCNIYPDDRESESSSSTSSMDITAVPFTPRRLLRSSHRFLSHCYATVASASLSHPDKFELDSCSSVRQESQQGQEDENRVEIRAVDFPCLGVVDMSAPLPQSTVLGVSMKENCAQLVLLSDKAEMQNGNGRNRSSSIAGKLWSPTSVEQASYSLAVMKDQAKVQESRDAKRLPILGFDASADQNVLHQDGAHPIVAQLQQSAATEDDNNDSWLPSDTIPLKDSSTPSSTDDSPLQRPPGNLRGGRLSQVGLGASLPSLPSSSSNNKDRKIKRPNGPSVIFV